MKEKDTITGANIVEDNISTMVNNGDGDIDYNSSPCVVMNNLVKEHNGKADEMGEAAMSSSALDNNVSQGNVSSNTSNLNINLNDNFKNEVKSFDPPVDYETAFEDYYPDNEQDTEKSVHQRKG